MDSVPQARRGGTRIPGKTRRAVACNHCREKKIRCNGNIPCGNCLDRAEECVVTTRGRPRIQGSQDYDSADLSRRVRQIETLLRTSNRGSKLQRRAERASIHQSTLPSEPPSLTDRTSTSPEDDEQRSNQVVYSETIDHVPETHQSQQGPSISQPLIFIHQQPGNQTATRPQASNVSPNVFDIQNIEQEDSSVYATETMNLEYYGPRSFLSVCSQPGVDWVISKVKSPDFRGVAMRLVADVARMLKMSGTLSPSRAPEPSPEIAWQYTKAYFEETPEEAFGIVERSWFESRLRSHFSGTMPDDKSYYALRNVLWARGCRIVLSKTASFREASQASWAFFENALSVHTEIMFLPGSMMGVQALILMAYYSEGLGKMSLQYMLCSNAMRLACSKGLHRQPTRSWNISPHEVKHRNWMFWSIYCLEKQICSRSGRPSVMDDDEVSCEVPESVPSGQPGHTIYCHILIEMMRLSSTAKKALSSARALRQTPDQLIDTVRELNKELDELKRSTQPKFCLDGPLDVSQLPKGITLRQAQSLQYHYYCLVLDINTPLAYPWSGICTYAKQDMAAFAQIETSWSAVAQASRSVILATRQIRLDASCSALIALYTPMYSFINLFIHILRGATTTQSDLVILDIALGYFSNLEFATDLELSLPFVRDMCHYARLAEDQKKKSKQQGIEEMKNKTEDPTFPSDNQMTDPIDVDSAAALPPNEDDFFGWLPDENLEAWSTLLQFTETGDTLFSSFGNSLL